MGAPVCSQDKGMILLHTLQTTSSTDNHFPRLQQSLGFHAVTNTRFFSKLSSQIADVVLLTVSHVLKWFVCLFDFEEKTDMPNCFSS